MGNALKLFRTPLGLAVAIVLTPDIVFAASPAVRVTDVALQAEGAMIGRVVDSRGAAQPGREVSVLQAQRVVATARTNQDGDFAVGGLVGGSYVVKTANCSTIVRAWTAYATPPTAQRGILLVDDDDAVIRGQGVLANPNRAVHFVIGMIIGTGVGIWIFDDDGGGGGGGGGNTAS